MSGGESYQRFSPGERVRVMSRGLTGLSLGEVRVVEQVRDAPSGHGQQVILEGLPTRRFSRRNVQPAWFHADHFQRVRGED